MQENAVASGKELDFAGLARDIKQWGRALGFDEVGVADCDLSDAEPRFREWLARGWHGEMDYMARHGERRARPAELVPGTISVITARLNYTPAGAHDSWETLEDPASAFVSRYALGRDYHKVLRAKLQALADRGAERERGGLVGKESVQR